MTYDVMLKRADALAKKAFRLNIARKIQDCENSIRTTWKFRDITPNALHRVKGANEERRRLIDVLKAA